jgi:hypothetical protein
MLDNLIKEGESLKSIMEDSAFGTVKIIRGEEYEKWIAKSSLYIDKYYKDSPLNERFANAARAAKDNTDHHYNVMLGILKGIKEFEDLENDGLPF